MKAKPKLISTFILDYDHMFLIFHLKMLMYNLNMKSFKFSVLLTKKYLAQFNFYIIKYESNMIHSKLIICQ